ncbi:hypothetical protein BD309DRAFT_1083963 [Dichomitus squalens]|nr:hypothetical protein BD309DRAFT_1083963 [Dichomitus squalens]
MPHVVSDVSIGDPGVDDGPQPSPELLPVHAQQAKVRQGPSRAASAGVDFSSAGLLIKVLSNALNLRVLHIRDAEPLFHSHSAVYESVTKLDRLKVLSLYYIGNICLKAISQLQGKLQVIENGLWKDGPRPQGDVTPFGRYVESLRHIQLWECGCMFESVIDRHVWPDVHTLDISGRIAKISALGRAFPNLRGLVFRMGFSVKQETGPVVCWPELDYLETNTPILLFPLRVRRLQLQYQISAKSGSQNDLKTLRLMEKTSSVVPSVTLSHTLSEVSLGRMKSSMPSLPYMEIVVNDRACGRAGVQWQTFEDCVVQNPEIMPQTSLVGLCISGRFIGVYGTDTGDMVEPAVWLDVLEIL